MNLVDLMDARTRREMQRIDVELYERYGDEWTNELPPWKACWLIAVWSMREIVRLRRKLEPEPGGGPG